MKYATVALSTDGALAAGGTTKTPIRVWDIASGKAMAELAGPESDVLALEFSPDGTILASAHFDGSVRLWSLPVGELLRTLEGHPETWPVLDLVFAEGGKQLASGGDYSKAFVWDVATAKPIREVSWPAYMIHDEPCPPRKRCYAPELVRRRVICVAFRGGSLLTFSKDGIAEQIAIASGESESKQQLRGEFRSAVATVDGSLIAAVVDHSGELVVFDPISGEVSMKVEPDTSEEARLIQAPTDAVAVNAVAFLAGGKLVAAAHRDGVIRLWNPESGSVVDRLEQTPSAVPIALAVSADDTRLIAITSDG
ncbi:MAG: PQQ-binding-like beta-propeller repeat protein, partial [Deltaproteobacteria bacterium]|nr:PQQ-binding-like beta-propeller repeat protein [Deltaproteobacteria bacterium]